jgi:hypothetical protein
LTPAWLSAWLPVSLLRLARRNAGTAPPAGGGGGSRDQRTPPHRLLILSVLAAAADDHTGADGGIERLVEGCEAFVAGHSAQWLRA